MNSTRRDLARRANDFGVTLDGHRAVVSGVRNDFATIIDMVTGAEVEFAWPTVERIVAKGGAFHS